MNHFAMLTHKEQRTRIQQMSTSGIGDHTIAAIAMLFVEMVRAILGEHENR
jgi:hypothetical protein